MNYEELSDLLKSTTNDIETIKTFWNNSHLEGRFHELTKATHQEQFWQNPNQAAISKELQSIRLLKEEYDSLMLSHHELPETLELFKEDKNELINLSKDITRYVKSVSEFKISLLLSDSRDADNCFLNLNAGAGGTEAQDWADMLLRMYVRFCENNNLSARIVDYQAGEEAGVKSTTLYIKGKNPFGMLKSEQGIHRLVRISPFDANKRRHTSFVGVTIIPEMPEIEVTIDQNDLRIDTYRAGGAGGQHVNKTDSAVRITHIPTGIVTQCQNERSQLQNKETALKMLKAKLAQKLEQEREEKIKGSSEKKKIEWGSQIRSYILQPYKLVKDHRTGCESPQPERVLDGELNNFIESYLIWSQSSQSPQNQAVE